MKKLFIALVGFMFVAGPVFAGAANDMAGPMRLRDVSVADVISIYEEVAGKKVAVTSEVKAVKAFLTIRSERIPKEEFLRTIEEALANQAGIEIINRRDGILAARKIDVKT